MRVSPVLVFAAVFLCLLARSLPVWADDTTDYDEATFKAAGLKTDGASLLDFFAKRTLSDNDQARREEMVRRMGDNSSFVREQASAALVAKGRPALPVLRLALQDPDLEIVRRAERCLEVIDNGTASNLTMAAARLL